jgi:hypothetical protein
MGEIKTPHQLSAARAGLLAIDLEVVEAFLGRRLSRRWLGELIGMDVEAEHPPVAVGKILDQEFGYPMLESNPTTRRR